MKAPSPHRSDRPVAIWLLVGVFMIIVQIILGGITRLTDSGLSITEWKPILGSLPPMNEQQWQEAFEKYKQIAQFKQMHAYFTLENFKSIFFWEWFHRNWGRLIGIVFLVPFLVFLAQRRFHKGIVRPLVILFLLGGLQGLIGWIMVASGLNDEDLYVSHIRLMIHFLTAMGLLVYTFWFALQLLLPERFANGPVKGRALLTTVLVLLVVQLAYGAFMAGLKAAPAAPTWPDINGSYLPANMGRHAGQEHSFLSALVNDRIAVHFIHRNLAYVLTLLVFVLAFVMKAPHPRLRKARWIPVVLVLLQVALGVASVLTSPSKVPQQWGAFEWNAQLHQFVAMLLLLSLVYLVYLSARVARR